MNNKPFFICADCGNRATFDFVLNEDNLGIIVDGWENAMNIHFRVDGYGRLVADPDNLRKEVEKLIYMAHRGLFPTCTVCDGKAVRDLFDQGLDKRGSCELITMIARRYLTDDELKMCILKAGRSDFCEVFKEELALRAEGLEEKES